MSKARQKKETVAHLTYFVVQPFKMVKNTRAKISADDPIPARDHDHALGLVERFRSIRAGVVAFRRTGDPTTGDWDDAVIIARHGIVPAEVDQMRDASEAEFESWDLTEAELNVA